MDADQCRVFILNLKQRDVAGLATGIASDSTLYGFGKLGFREIIAMTDLENVASPKVLEKIGFVRRGFEYTTAKKIWFIWQKIRIIFYE